MSLVRIDDHGSNSHAAPRCLEGAHKCLRRRDLHGWHVRCDARRRCDLSFSRSPAWPLAAPTSTAFACGGFFCSSSPINQSREVVVYGHEPDGSLTMAVQINYSGMDEDFAWILPVPVPPDDIAVGTDALFQQLQQSTEPQLVTVPETTGTCRQASCSFPSYGCGFGCGAADSAESVPPTALPDAGMGVTVHSEGIVGPYDTVVLGAATAAEVLTWLGENGYDVPTESEPLLDPYARQGFVFIALRLNANRDSNTIRPIVMRMATDEACLPIRLTAIATTPDLPIALFFLGDAQARSTNYSFVDPTESVDLWMRMSTWDATVAAQVREMGGQAFATDYAGPSPTLSLELPDVADLASSSSASDLLEGLMSRGYRGTPLLLELFQTYIPPPEGEDPQQFYNCLGSGSRARSCGEPRRFDPVGLIDAITESIVHAAARGAGARRASRLHDAPLDDDARRGHDHRPGLRARRRPSRGAAATRDHALHAVLRGVLRGRCTAGARAERRADPRSRGRDHRRGRGLPPGRRSPRLRWVLGGRQQPGLDLRDPHGARPRGHDDLPTATLSYRDGLEAAISAPP